LSQPALAALSTTFDEEVRTHGWPGSTQFRFAGESGAILIWSSQDQADWFIAAATAGALKSMLTAIWLLDGVGKALYDCSEIGKIVLNEIRGKA